MLMTGVIQLDAIPTPPASRAVPRNTPVQLKYALWTNESTSVTSQSTRMNGFFSRLKASDQAVPPTPAAARTCAGAFGRIRLNAARANDARPETMKVHR